MIAPLPAPDHAVCTTSGQIVSEALEPTLDILAADQEELRQLAIIQAATKRLAQLAELRTAAAMRASGYLDRRASNLAAAEQGKAAAGVVQLANAKSIGREINQALDCLSCAERAGEHQAARGLLHNQLATHGTRVLSGPIAERVGKKRMAALRAEYDAWSAER